MKNSCIGSVVIENFTDALTETNTSIARNCVLQVSEGVRRGKKAGHSLE